MNILENLEKKSNPVKMSIGFALIGAIGVLDFLTGFELSFSVFYVIPISLATWLVSRSIGIVVSFASAFIWFMADMASGHNYSHALIPFWNSLIRLSFFVIITLLIAAVKNVTEREKALAHTDSLTGAANSRLFFELAQMEIDRSQRYQYAFTLVYIDLDNFKTVNDELGHIIGDQVLRTVVNYTKKHLRKTDVLARLGGDEFALLLPETSQESARIALTKLQEGLVAEMQNNNWPITFSMGVLTCTVAPPNTNELVKMADELMYAVKRRGKNALKYATYAG